MVDGVGVEVADHMTRLDRHHDLFSFTTHLYVNGQPGPERRCVVAVEVPGAPADLAYGRTEPVAQDVVDTGDAAFDRAFNVRRAPEATLGWLDDERRSRLLQWPVSWLADGWLVTKLHLPGAEAQIDQVRRLVATSRSVSG